MLNILIYWQKYVKKVVNDCPRWLQSSFPDGSQWYVNSLPQSGTAGLAQSPPWVALEQASSGRKRLSIYLPRSLRQAVELLEPWFFIYITSTEFTFNPTVAGSIASTLPLGAPAHSPQKEWWKLALFAELLVPNRKTTPTPQITSLSQHVHHSQVKALHWMRFTLRLASAQWMIQLRTT